MNDFYFSKKRFNNDIKIATSDDYEMGWHISDIYVCEVNINGEWRIFTEQLTTGHEPVTKHLGDLVFVGTQEESQTRYTPILEWLKENQELIK